MRLPRPRGPVSSVVVERLAGPPAPLSRSEVAAGLAGGGGDAVLDEDLQLALTCCYELHYRGLDGVDERWEWEPSLLSLRARMEARFEDDLRARVAARYWSGPAAAGPVDREIRRLVDADDGPSLSTYVARRATYEQVRELVVHRSIYQLKEADPHSWGLPRLSGRPKAALVEIQYDEYGEGRAERMHSALFAATMRELGLDDSYGAYLDLVPASTLATVNLISFFGLHRRWRAALLGHLAAFEMTSSVPNRRYGDGLRRLGFGRTATEFYDEHVTADAVHESIALVDLCGSLVAAEPALAVDVIFGTACCLAVEGAFASRLLDSWRAGASSLLDTTPSTDAADLATGAVATA